jgi:hypothetical protein
VVCGRDVMARELHWLNASGFERIALAFASRSQMLASGLIGARQPAEFILGGANGVLFGGLLAPVQDVGRSVPLDNAVVNNRVPWGVQDVRKKLTLLELHTRLHSSVGERAYDFLG